MGSPAFFISYTHHEHVGNKKSVVAAQRASGGGLAGCEAVEQHVHHRCILFGTLRSLCCWEQRASGGHTTFNWKTHFLALTVPISTFRHEWGQLVLFGTSGAKKYATACRLVLFGSSSADY